MAFESSSLVNEQGARKYNKHSFVYFEESNSYDSDGAYTEECIDDIENCELSRTLEGRLVKLAFSNNTGSLT